MSQNPVRRSCAKPHQCSVDVRLKAMSQSPLSRDLHVDEHRDLDNYLSAWSWAEGDPIILAGEKSTGSYLIVAGRVRVTRDTADGREITVDIATPGDVIGELHTHPTQAIDSAWAMETTCALYLPAGSLADVIKKYPALALAIVRMQQDRLTQSRERDIGQTTRSVEQRVGAVLRNLDNKLGHHQQDGSSLIQVRLRRDDIAGMAGTTIESTSRAMSKMKKSGIIDSGREWVSILDHDNLDALIDRE